MSALRSANRKYFVGMVIVLVGLMILPPSEHASGSQAGLSLSTIPTPGAFTPFPLDKNGAPALTLGTGEELFGIIPPASLSKNSNVQPVRADDTGASFAGFPGLGSKNTDDRRPSIGPSDPLAAMLAAGGSLLTCGVVGNMTWNTTASDFQIIRQCTLTVPQDGSVFISADGSVGRQDGEFEANFELDVDSTVGDATVDRWINVYNDSGDGTDESVALSTLRPVTAGVHTVYFLGRRYAGAGTAVVYDPTLTVIFIPAANSQVVSCGAVGNLTWTTTARSFQAMRQCQLTVPQAGWVYFTATGSVGRQNGEYEALFNMGIDSASGDSGIDRWVNIYNDSGDGTDKTVALRGLKSVTAGTHTFNFLGQRYAGGGTVTVFDPSLTVIFIPAANSQAVTCGASGDMTWTTTSSSFQIIRQCTLTVPQTGWVFMSTDGSLGRQDGEYEAQIDIGVDSTTADFNSDRWVNVYNDSGDGTDKSVALSALKSMSAGVHTFYLLGKRYAGAGTVLVYDPTLTVIAPGMQVELPLLMKNP